MAMALLVLCARTARLEGLLQQQETIVCSPVASQDVAQHTLLEQQVAGVHLMAPVKSIKLCACCEVMPINFICEYVICVCAGPTLLPAAALLLLLWSSSCLTIPSVPADCRPTWPSCSLIQLMSMKQADSRHWKCCNRWATATAGGHGRFSCSSA